MQTRGVFVFSGFAWCADALSVPLASRRLNPPEASKLLTRRTELYSGSQREEDVFLYNSSNLNALRILARLRVALLLIYILFRNAIKVRRAGDKSVIRSERNSVCFELSQKV